MPDIWTETEMFDTEVEPVVPSMMTPTAPPPPAAEYWAFPAVDKEAKRQRASPVVAVGKLTG
jgi:hypothetical protein